MKVQLVKCSDKSYWYRGLNFPKQYEVEKEDYKYIITEDCVDKGSYLYVVDCINDETYTEEVEDRLFPSGAKRDGNKNKIRPDLISPLMLKRLGTVLAEGAKHYGERNWEKGIPDECFKESASRHYLSWMNDEQDEDHASKLIFNIMGWIHNQDK